MNFVPQILPTADRYDIDNLSSIPDDNKELKGIIKQIDINDRNRTVEEHKKIFEASGVKRRKTKQLTNIYKCTLNGKVIKRGTKNEIAEVIGFSPSTVVSWCSGASISKVGYKVELVKRARR